MIKALLCLIVVIGALHAEARPQRPKQIFVRQNPKVSRPPPIPPIIYGTPLRFQAPSAPRRPRHTNAGNPLVKKSTKNAPKPKKYGPAPPPPPQIITARPSLYVAPKPVKNETPKSISPKISINAAPAQVRNERQITPANFNAPKPSNGLKVVAAPKVSTFVGPKQEKVEEPKIIVAPKQQKIVKTEPIRKERQVVAPEQPKAVAAKPAQKENLFKAPEQPKFVAANPSQKARQFVAPDQPSFVAIKPIRNERQISSSSYNSPLSDYNAAPVNSDYNAAPVKNIYHSSNFEAQPTSIEARTLPVATPRQPSYKASGRSNEEPIAITRYTYNSPTGEEQEGDDVFNYDFGTENGISQKAVGTMKVVNDAPVVVMRGSYEYVDGGVTYEVTWVADENGFQPSAPKSKHLPTPVAIPFPEQQAAVDAQIRFAEEETRLRAAASTRSSSNSGSYIAADLSNYSEGSRRRI